MTPLNPPISGWQNSNVWIVGASSGIGAALAKALSQQGARLALSARRASKLQTMAGPEDLVLPLDVVDLESMEQAAEKIIQDWGQLDLAIYCAGVYHPMRAWQLNQTQVRETLSINLQGAFNLLQVTVPHLLERGKGAICLVSSVAAYTGLPKALAYGPSKAALVNLAEVLYSDLAPQGIGVYLVNPGFVETRLTKQNDFNMPALMSAEAAAASIIEGFRRGRFEIHFPKRFTLWMRLLSRLPDRLRFWLIGKAAT